MTIQVDVKSTKKDYYTFQKHNAYQFIWVYIGFIILIALLAAINIKTKIDTGAINNLWLFLAIFATAAFIFVIVNNTRKIVSAAKKEELKPLFSYTFSKGGVHCDSNGKSFDIPWTGIYRVAEKKEMFLIYLNTQSALIIPKRCFANDGDIKEFSENLLFKPRKKVKKRAKKGIL